MSGLEVVYFLVSLPRTMYIHAVVFSFNTVNLVKPVHISDNSRSPSSITSNDALVGLATSMYFSRKGNDSSRGTYSFTLGST